MALIPLQFGGELSSISLQFQKPSYDDRGGDSTTNDARSRFDRIAIVEFFHESSGPSDGTLGEWTVRS